MLDLDNSGEGIAYPKALIECVLRSPYKKDVGTGRKTDCSSNFGYL